MNNPPGFGRFAHYVSKRAPHVESVALIVETPDTWLGLLPSAHELTTPTNLEGLTFAEVMQAGLDSPRHACLQVFGAVNVYPEWNIPYSGPIQPAAVSGDALSGVQFKQPGTWHWWDECGTVNDHVHVAPSEEPTP